MKDFAKGYQPSRQMVLNPNPTKRQVVGCKHLPTLVLARVRALTTVRLSCPRLRRPPLKIPKEKIQLTYGDQQRKVIASREGLNS